ncbi:hypothetical protein INQ23_28275, partial [Escherichia coli]|nr:hypothetical protein [Escherichia coli]
MLDGFTREHGCKRLVWFEVHAEMEPAIIREKRIKKWNRAWKLKLIEESNPTWRDLAEDWGFDPLKEEKPSLSCCRLPWPHFLPVIP